MNPETQVYLNGKIVPSSEAHIAIYDASVVLGATLTDMERTFGHQLFRLDEHLDRFLDPVNTHVLIHPFQRVKPEK